MSSGFPQLAAGVSLALLQRVWDATPSDRRWQRQQFLDNIVRVKRGNHAEARPLCELTLVDVERAIGSTSPSYVVHYFDVVAAKRRCRTFVNFDDAKQFAMVHKLARIETLGGRR